MTRYRWGAALLALGLACFAAPVRGQSADDFDRQQKQLATEMERWKAEEGALAEEQDRLGGLQKKADGARPKVEHEKADMDRLTEEKEALADQHAKADADLAGMK